MFSSKRYLRKISGSSLRTVFCMPFVILDRKLEEISSSWGERNVPSAYAFDEDRTARVHLVIGKDLYVSLDDLGIARELMQHGLREHSATFVTSKMVRQARTILDIGANIGYYLAVYATSAKAVHIHAIEPDPRNRLLLKKNIKTLDLDPIATVHAIAIADKDEFRPFTMSEKYNWSHLERIEELIGNAQNSIMVQCLKLDTFADGKKLYEPIFVRCDIEGFEHELVKGGANFLSRAKNICFFVEWHTMLMENRGLKPGELLSRIKDLGFSVTYITGRRRRVARDISWNRMLKDWRLLIGWYGTHIFFTKGNWPRIEKASKI